MDEALPLDGGRGLIPLLERIGAEEDARAEAEALEAESYSGPRDPETGRPLATETRYADGSPRGDWYAAPPWKEA